MQTPFQAGRLLLHLKWRPFDVRSAGHKAIDIPGYRKIDLLQV